MGLANYFGWDGVDSWVGGNRNTLMGLSADLLSGNPGGGRAMMGRQQDDANAIRAKEEAERQRQIQAATEYLRQSGQEQFAGLLEGMGDIGQASQLYNAVNPASQDGLATDAAARQKLADEYGLADRERVEFILTGKLPGGNQSVRAGLGQPIVLRNKQTQESRPFMPMSDGTYIDPLSQQLADESWEYDPAYVAFEKARGTTLGGDAAGAQFDLPKSELIAQQTIEAINAVRNEQAGMDEHFGAFMGVPQQMTPAWPGSPKAKFQVAAERAINRAFLEGREMLKGGGTITDFESRKAEDAITEARLAMEKGDKAQFLRALDTFERAVTDGVMKLRQQAGTSLSGTGAPTAGASGGGWSVIGVE